jgi:hypothetical protein
MRAWKKCREWKAKRGEYFRPSLHVLAADAEDEPEQEYHAHGNAEQPKTYQLHDRSPFDVSV